MLLLIDKPKGMTSHDVVDEIRKITGIKKVGHGGTLDPNATGLLIIGITRGGTKKLGEIAKNKDKVYEAEIVLGEERDTHDSEGVVTQNSKLRTQKEPSEKVIKNILKRFVGKQDQVPPSHSAIKIKGKKAYELAREGKEVELKPRKIVIHSVELIECNFPILKIRTKVSSGTYIRALARDIGRELGTYGYLSNLRRIEIGDFKLVEAVDLESLNKENWKRLVLE